MKTIKKLFNKVKNYVLSNKRKLIPYIIVLTILLLSVGYSAFISELNITGIASEIRIKKDIRITGLAVEPETEEDASIVIQNNGGITTYTEYNVKNISAGITLPEEDSSITFNVEITNFEGPESGIYEITGLPDNLEYDTLNYDLKQKICNDSGVCSTGIRKNVLIKVRYKEGSYNSEDKTHEIVMNFDFQPFYTVTYTNIEGENYPTEIIGKDTLIVDFGENAPKALDITMENIKVTDFTYENGVLNLPNVNGDIVIKNAKAYLATLTKDLYFKESAHIANIKTASFETLANYDANATDYIATYDLSEAGDNSIIGWIDADYNLHIGSDAEIYAKDLTDAFYNMTGLTSITFDNLNTSENTSLYATFYNNASLTNLDLSSFDTTNVTSMQSMVNGASALETIDLSSFDTSKVTTMSSMFKNTTKLQSLNLNNFNTQNVTAMPEMFYGTSSLATLDLSNFNTAKVTNMSYMFNGASALTSLNLSNFNTANVTTMTSMFNGVSALETLDVRHFNTANVTQAQSMFQNMTNLKYLNVNEDGTGNGVLTFNFSKVTSFGSIFNGCKGLTTLDLSGVTTTTKLASMYKAFAGMTSLTEIKFADENGNTKLVTSNAKNWAQLFETSNKLTTIDLTPLDTSASNNMSYMFNGCAGLQNIILDDSFKTSNVETMAHMFNGNISLTTLDLSNFDTAKVKNTMYMFYTVQSLTELDVSMLDTSSVTNMNRMFSGMTNLKTLKFFDDEGQTKFVTYNETTQSGVTNMERMFGECSSLTELDLSNFNTTSVTNMSSMFTATLRLAKIYVGPNWNVDETVVNVTNMFYGSRVSGVTLKTQ